MPSARTIALAAILLTAGIAAPYAPGQDPPPAAEFPTTPEGRVTRAFLETINSGDKEAMTAFLTANLSKAALDENPVDVYANMAFRLYTQSGGFDLMRILQVGAPGDLRFTARTKRGGHWAQLSTRLASGDGDKLDDWRVRRILDPEAEKADAWATAKMSEADAIREIARHVDNAAKDDRFSGVALVAKGDRVVFNRAYGVADRTSGIPNQLDTRFNLGSMNKMFTGIAIAQLVQAGKLSFETTLARVVPEYPNKEAAAKITVHQLLTHTSGMGDFFKPEFFKDREKYRNPKDYFPIFAHDPLRFEPGTSWSYSNAGFIVLGAIVENVSGRNYFDYVKDHIYAPAGMKDTASFGTHEAIPNLAIGYTRSGSADPMGLDPPRPNRSTLPGQGSPAGGGYSSAPDLHRFARALRAHKLLNAEFLEMATGGKVAAPMGAKYGYGFFDETIEGKSVRGHTGGAPGINSCLHMFWDDSYTVIVLGNYDPPGAQELGRQISRFLARQ